jgi:two-component system sensor histidine kinase YesM
MDNISADIDDLVYLSKWCRSNDTISEYLETPTLPSSVLTLDAFDRLKEEYQNTIISEYIKRIVISDDKDKFIQIIGNNNDFYDQDMTSFHEIDFFDDLLYSETFEWIGVTLDPFVKNRAKQIIPVVRPIYSTYGINIVGWTYITVSAKMLTEQFENYSIPEDSNIYITIGSNTYLIEKNLLTEVERDYEIMEVITGVAHDDDTLVQLVKQSNGDVKTLVSSPTSKHGWYLSQSLSNKQLTEQRGWYYFLLFACSFVIILVGTLLVIYLNHIINTPINKIRHKIKNISSGDFSYDPTIEWSNELGEIGKGINTLAYDVVNLMDKRIADESQKNELEYQVSLNQINPHFLYNTLNSIKWMATIQNADGIASMVSSLASLLKKVSKETQPLITIKDELSILDDYFLILKFRYGGNITIEYNLESEDLYDCQILRFTLQPLIENAIFHGIEPKGEVGHICIDIRRNEDGDILIGITDDGVGMTEEQITKTLSETIDTSSALFKKIGIANVKNRIQYTYGDKYGLSIHSELGKYTKMTIVIPYRKQIEV